MKPALRLAEIIDQFGEEYTGQQPSGYIQKTLSALQRCRTAALGGHVDRCADDSCGQMRISYNSCRNRHCPQCQNTQKEQWLARMEYRTLPINYFHGVFTIPHEFNGLCIRYPYLIYDLLFKTTWATINGFSKHPQYGIAQTGMTAVLHTWGQQLSLHPHLHCIIPAGGITPSGKWKNLKGSPSTSSGPKQKSKKKKGFLFPINELRKVYQAKFMAGLRKLIKQGHIEKQDPKWLNEIYKKQWVVYAKTRFGGAKQVIEYLGRYTHKVAISNHRLLKMDDKTVTFAYKDYTDKGKTKTMELNGVEFLRRFAQHILPPGFTKIRHFGLHSGACQAKMDDIFQEFYQMQRPKYEKKNWQVIAYQKTGFQEACCPKCKQNTMHTVATWHQGRPPPLGIINSISNT